MAVLEPSGSDGFLFRVETYAIRPHGVQVTEETPLVPRESEGTDRHGDAHVDADHAAVGSPGKLAGVSAVLGVDNGAVRKGIGVHDGEPFLKIPHALDAKHGPEDFLFADAHAGRDVIKQRRTEEEAVFISWNGDAAPVEDQFGTFPDTSLDPVKDVLSAGSRYQRPSVVFLS